MKKDSEQSYFVDYKSVLLAVGIEQAQVGKRVRLACQEYIYGPTHDDSGSRSVP